MSLNFTVFSLIKTELPGRTNFKPDYKKSSETATQILSTFLCEPYVDAVKPPSTQSGNGRPLSGVHSIMLEKLAQPGEGGGARSPTFTISTITCKVVVYAPAERADTLPLFLLYPYKYSVVTMTEEISRLGRRMLYFYHRAHRETMRH